jgi:hypothetical protein
VRAPVALAAEPPAYDVAGRRRPIIGIEKQHFSRERYAYRGRFYHSAAADILVRSD